MAMREVKAACPKISKESAIQFDFGNNVNDAIAKFGADVVFGGFVADATVTLQSAMRRYMEKGQDPAALTTTWKPGTRAPAVAVDPKTAAINAFRSMTPEERAELLKELRNQK